MIHWLKASGCKKSRHILSVGCRHLLNLSNIGEPELIGLPIPGFRYQSYLSMAGFRLSAKAGSLIVRYLGLAARPVRVHLP